MTLPPEGIFTRVGGASVPVAGRWFFATVRRNPGSEPGRPWVLVYDRVWTAGDDDTGVREGEHTLRDEPVSFPEPSITLVHPLSALLAPRQVVLTLSPIHSHRLDHHLAM